MYEQGQMGTKMQASNKNKDPADIIAGLSIRYPICEAHHKVAHEDWNYFIESLYPG